MSYRVAHPLFLSTSVSLVVLLSSCSTSNEIVSNFYDDGIYYDSEYGGSWVAEDLGLVPSEESSPAPYSSMESNSEYDYYDPSFVEEMPEVQNSSSVYYGSPGGMMSPFGMSNWNMSFYMGMGSFYSPWANPYMGFYDPFHSMGWGGPMYGYGFNPYYGSFWNPYSPFGSGRGFGSPYGGYYCPSGVGFGNAGFENRPLAGSTGRAYNGPMPNRYNYSTGGKSVSGSGKRDNSPVTSPGSFTADAQPVSSRLRNPSSNQSVNRSANASRSRTSNNMASSRLPDVRNSGTSPQNTASRDRLPARSTTTPNRSAEPVRTRSSNNSWSLPRTSTPRSTESTRSWSRPSSTTTPSRSTQPSRSYEPSSRTRSQPSRTRSNSSSFPSRSTSPSRGSSSRSSGGGSRSSGVIRR